MLTSTEYNIFSKAMQDAGQAQIDALRLHSAASAHAQELSDLISKLHAARVGKKAIAIVQAQYDAAQANAHSLRLAWLAAVKAEWQATDAFWLAQLDELIPAQQDRVRAIIANHQTYYAEMTGDPAAYDAEPDLPPDLGIGQAESDEGDDEADACDHNDTPFFTRLAE